LCSSMLVARSATFVYPEFTPPLVSKARAIQV
jgi:hypothetical protein